MPDILRTDSVGSLLRPEKLHEARARFASGTLDATGLRQVEDEAIRDAVRLQNDIGLAVFTDGEFRRENWWIDFVSKLEGIVIETGQGTAFGPAGDLGATQDKDLGEGHGHEHNYVPKTVRTAGRIRADGAIMLDDYRFLASLSRRGIAKVTIPSPTRLHFHGGRNVVSTEVYPDIEAFYADVAAVYRKEIAALEAAGCRYIQIDDPLLAYFLSPTMREGVRAEGDDPDERLRRYVRLINECIAERSPGTLIGLHICRGNARSLALSEGPYDGLAEACFPHLQVDRFLLEYDDGRSGGFEPLRLIPRDKQVVLGLITTKRPELEDKALLIRRIEEAACYVELDRLAISPQCGFASVVEGNAITPADQIAKLGRAVEVAREVWGP